MIISRGLLGIFAAGALLLPLSGCTSSPHDADERYYLVSANIQIPYWQTAGAGFNKAGGEMKVRVEMVGPDSYDPKAEKDEFQRVVKLKPAGILVSAADPGLLQPDIDAAIGAGIPVITIDSDAPQSKRLLFVGTNNYQAGLMGGQVAARRMQGRGTAVVFTMPGQKNLVERLSGYREAFAAHPQIKIIEVVDIQGSGRVAFDKAREILAKHKNNVDGFICLEALAGKEVADVLDRTHLPGKTVVAMDTDDGTLEWIRKGMIVATIAQKPYTMAYYGLKTLDELHHHKPNLQETSLLQGPFAPLPTLVDTGATLIDKDNLDAFIKARDAAAPKQK